MRISDWSSDVCSSDLFRLFMIAILLCLAIIIILAGLRARKISPLSMLAKLFSHFAKAPPPLAHAPEGRRIYAIGDIHGHLDLLDGLLAQIFADERTGGVSGELIFLGDLINRGPQSAQVVERLINLRAQRPEPRFLPGNHEDLFLTDTHGKPDAIHL